jgi:excisionase family DNA binding protein
MTADHPAGPASPFTDLPLLLTARQAAALVGVDESTWNRWIRDGRIPSSVIHPVTYGQPKRRRYSRWQIERWAAGNVDSKAS